VAESLHLICKPNGGAIAEGLSIIAKPAIYSSESWEIDPETAKRLINGWIYLHVTKSNPSYFGGRILRVEPGAGRTAAGAPETKFIFEASPQARGQHWRGAAHGMAWWSGPVPANLPHEL
jgi:hypothetical protein